MVARAFWETSGRTWSSTSPFPALALGAEVEELAGVFDASGDAFVSVRSAAGEGDPAGVWEGSFADDLAAAADLDESRDESRPEEALGFAARETPPSGG